MDKSIYDFLLAEMNRTREQYYSAKERAWSISADIPSGLPHPDGVKRIQNAARDESAALDNYINSLRRLNDYVLDGVVPEDLKDPRKKPAAGEKRDSENRSQKAGS